MGEDLYIIKDNGREMLIYAKDSVYELECQDYVRSSTGGLPTLICFGFIIFGILCLVTLFIKLVAFIIRKLRRKKKVYTASDKRILTGQFIYGVSGIIFACFILFIGAVNPAFTAVSGILAALLGLGSIVNGIALCYDTIKSNTKILAKIKPFAWVALCVAYSVFIVTMQLYCFWKL